LLYLLLGVTILLNVVYTVSQKNIVKFPLHLNVCFCTTWREADPSIIHVKMNEKNVNNFSSGQSFGPEHPVCYKVLLLCSSVSTRWRSGMTEFKKWLVKLGLVWSRTLSILLTMNGENVFMPVFA